MVHILAKVYDEIPSSSFTKSWRKARPNWFLLIETNKENNADESKVKGS